MNMKTVTKTIGERTALSSTTGILAVLRQSGQAAWAAVLLLLCFTASGAWAESVNCLPSDIGKVLGMDGKVYATVSAAGGMGSVAGMIAYVNTSTNEGIAIGPSDLNWNSTEGSGRTSVTNAISSCGGYTRTRPSAATTGWRLPSQADFNNMIGSDGCQSADNLRNMQGRQSSSCGVWAMIDDESYWSSTETPSGQGIYYNLYKNDCNSIAYGTNEKYVRPCFTFSVTEAASYRAYNPGTNTFVTLTANSCTAVTSSTTTMGTANTETWYVVSSNVTVSSSRIEVLGTVNLILADGKSMRAEKGLHVLSGVTLNIYGQSSGTGQLHSFSNTDQLAGIGGNNDQTSGTITIHGGSIEAIGAYQSAGIGGGRGGNGGTTTIYGGTVNATGGNYGAGIGGGAGGNGGTISIIGGTVIANAGTVDANDNSQAIGNGAGTSISGGTLVIDGIKVYSSANASNPVAPANRQSICQSKYAKLMPCTSHNFVNGVCTICGGTPDVGNPRAYLAYQTATQTFVHLEANNPTFVTGSTTTLGADNTETWYSVNNNVTVSSRITVNGTVHLILCDGKTLTANGGIAVSAGNALYIYSQSAGMGQLTANATGLNGSAGIGGGSSVGNITIHGGNITATGGDWSAGIGGGTNGGGGSITIYGGNVEGIGWRVNNNGNAVGIGHGSSGGAVAIQADRLRLQYYDNGWQDVTYSQRASGLENVRVRFFPCTQHSYSEGRCTHCGKHEWYTVTYDGNGNTGGSVPTDNTHYANDGTGTVTALGNTGNLVRTGYSFAGWNTAADGSGTNYAANATFTIYDNVTLYAQWTPITYTVRFHKNDGSGVFTDQTFTYNAEQALATNAFTRDGYQYLGWSTTTDGAVAYTDGQSVTNLANVQDAVVNLYAKWTELYTITYNLDGGTVATPNPTTYTALSDAITLTNPTRYGYTFAGWMGTDISGTAMTVIIAHGSTGNRAYTATWTLNTYTITYDLGGGSVTTDNPTSYTVESGLITLVNPNRVGYTFAGWTGTGLNEPAMTVTIAAGSTGNRKYTATWAARQLTLTDNAGNGNAINTAAGDGMYYDVTLADRTLYRDGNWNTLCLPFDVTISGSVLKGAIAKTLESTAFSNGTLTLNFGEDVSAIEAGKPYIIKWEIRTVDLSTLTANYTAQNGDVLTGTLGGNYKISIAAGATVTLNGATINGTDDFTYRWAGISCIGDATITLKGTNTVTGFHSSCPGIYVPSGSTLTIQGNGSLDANSNGTGAGIGGEYYSDCGNIEIKGGTINAATHSYYLPGIGGGVNRSCGTITISGGTVTAKGGEDAAGIGSAQYGTCGDITITDGVTRVTATRGREAPNSIGAGKGGSCGTVTIGGVVGAVSARTYTYTGTGLGSVSVSDNLENPVFTDVTISNTPANVSTKYVDFVGTYSPVVIYESDDEKHNLYLGSGNNIYYPTREGYAVKACRAYFVLKNGLTAGEPTNPTADVRAFVLDFGEGEVTDIKEIYDLPIYDIRFDAGAWYTLDGRKLNGKPSHRGVYVNNGRKVVIK